MAAADASKRLGALGCYGNVRVYVTYLAHTWALKLLYENPFKAQIYAMQVHGPSGLLGPCNYHEKGLSDPSP